MRNILKALLTNLADFVASDRADLLARQLTKAHDELADASAEVAALRSEMGALRADHERQRAAHMATLRQLSDRGPDSRESVTHGDWEWARRQLGAGNAVRNRIVEITPELGGWRVKPKSSSSSGGLFEPLLVGAQFLRTSGWELAQPQVGNDVIGARKAITEQVIEVISQRCEFGPGMLSTSDPLEKCGDSITRVEVVLALEDHFGIDIPDEELEGVATIGELVAVVHRIKAGAAS